MPKPKQRLSRRTILASENTEGFYGYSGSFVHRPPPTRTFEPPAATSEQHYELPQDQIQQMLDLFPGLPFVVEHEDEPIGELVSGSLDGNLQQGRCEIVLYDTPAAELYRQRIHKGEMLGLSLHHDPETLRPIEMSLCEVPARPGCYIDLVPTLPASMRLSHSEVSSGVRTISRTKVDPPPAPDTNPDENEENKSHPYKLRYDHYDREASTTEASLRFRPGTLRIGFDTPISEMASSAAASSSSDTVAAAHYQSFPVSANSNIFPMGQAGMGGTGNEAGQTGVDITMNSIVPSPAQLIAEAASIVGNRGHGQGQPYNPFGINGAPSAPPFPNVGQQPNALPPGASAQPGAPPAATGPGAGASDASAPGNGAAGAGDGDTDMTDADADDDGGDEAGNETTADGKSVSRRKVDTARLFARMLAGEKLSPDELKLAQKQARVDQRRQRQLKEENKELKGEATTLYKQLKRKQEDIRALSTVQFRELLRQLKQAGIDPYAKQNEQVLIQASRLAKRGKPLPAGIKEMATVLASAAAASSKNKSKGKSSTAAGAKAKASKKSASSAAGSSTKRKEAKAKSTKKQGTVEASQPAAKKAKLADGSSTTNKKAAAGGADNDEAEEEEDEDDDEELDTTGQHADAVLMQGDTSSPTMSSALGDTETSDGEEGQLSSSDEEDSGVDDDDDQEAEDAATSRFLNKLQHSARKKAKALEQERRQKSIANKVAKAKAKTKSTRATTPAERVPRESANAAVHMARPAQSHVVPQADAMGTVMASLAKQNKESIQMLKEIRSGDFHDDVKVYDLNDMQIAQFYSYNQRLPPTESNFSCFEAAQHYAAAPVLYVPPPTVAASAADHERAQNLSMSASMGWVSMFAAFPLQQGKRSLLVS